EPRIRVTPEALLGLADGDRYELVDGDLVERPVSKTSSLIAMMVGRKIGNHCDSTGSAWIFGPDLGCRCFPDDPDRVRKPDVSVVLKPRMPADQLEGGFLTIAPDLAVEVISPNDLAEDVERKIMEYLSAGVRLVWVVYPSTRSVHVFRADGSTTAVRESDRLDGGEVLPGFSVAVADLFPVR
ncbi:MAG TPA: Uma2 family endonuclease, partial [Isosphaeraceae bacterium]|nr:Uma2 family endonuclease [Isosphaeraceae bacterium]